MSNQESKTTKDNKKPKVEITERRRFIVLMAQSVGLSALGGLGWAGYVQEAKSAPLTLRPPGAVKESDFLKMCIKCGQCAEACPYDTLIIAKPGDNKPVGTPYFIARDIPCYMCEDIPCVPVCPTGALDVDSVSDVKDGKKELEIRKAQMGMAIIDKHSCVAFWGIQCDACYRACPLLDKALKLEYKQNKRTGKHAYLLPVIDENVCTGCGLCEHACVTDKPAIYVLPREVALGKVGDYYIKGWDKKDEKRLEGISTDVTTKTKRSEKKAQDYLNSGDLFNDK